MPLHLKIENETTLPDGGPVSITVTTKRGIDIGRDQYLDWVLPDPTRFISGKHAEVRFKDGSYWLTDVSTNGTFVNGGEFRMGGPHALKTGDRIDIGPYIISVVVEPEVGDAKTGAFTGGAGFSPGQVWDAGEAAPPVDPRSLRTPDVRRGIGSSDVLDWVADVPAPTVPAYAPPPPAFAPSPPAAAAPPVAPGRPAAPVKWDLTQHPFAPPTVDRQDEPPPDTPVAAAAPPPPPAPVRPVEPVVASPQPAPEAQARPAPSMPRVAAGPMPSAAPAAAPGHSDRVFIARFAQGLGVPEETISTRSAAELAELLGAFVRTTTENLKQLQTARAQSKGAMRSANQTMVQALDNNPVRFAPTTDDALRIMFGPRTKSYLDAQNTVENSFADIKKHQAMVFSAMQTALRDLLADLDPDQIESTIQADKGVASLLKSRQAKLWEHYRTTWKAKAGKTEHGMLDVYMRLFAEAYDKAT